MSKRMTPVTKPTPGWFEVDKQGLARLVDRRGKAVAILELVSNAWDQEVKTVKVDLAPTVKGRARICVEDDDPTGFSRLADAFTLYAPSGKLGEPEKRGRFNLGEKLLLSLCDSASVHTTKGLLVFDERGRTEDPEARRKSGSRVTAVLHMERSEIDETLALLRRLLPPQGIATLVNGEALPQVAPEEVLEASLSSEIADASGTLRRTRRKCKVELHRAHDGRGWVYELGIPVVESGDPWHYNVLQKVPLTMERDNVPPHFLADLRALAFNAKAADESVSVEALKGSWAREALEQPEADPAAVTAWVGRVYGERSVVYDPSDKEANLIAAAEGYTVVHSGALSAPAWANVRAAGALLPAGKVTPSPDAVSKVLPIIEDEWTTAMMSFAAYAVRFARAVAEVKISVRYVVDPQADYLATFGGTSIAPLVKPQLTLNLGLLSQGWLDLTHGPTLDQDALLLHELAHNRVSNHLDRHFPDEVARLGARMRRLERWSDVAGPYDLITGAGS